MAFSMAMRHWHPACVSQGVKACRAVIRRVFLITYYQETNRTRAVMNCIKAGWHNLQQEGWLDLRLQQLLWKGVWKHPFMMQ